ncbi:MAG: glycosyltransferase family 1 protein [Candidatus Magasanikbacteria bacterium]
MRIGIDARMIGKGFGIGRYIEQLVLHLENIDTENQYILFVNESGVSSKKFGKSFEIVEVNIPWYTLEEQFKFPGIIKKKKVDLMHFPHWNVPLFYTDPFVLTIHDLTMFHYPRPEATTLGPLKFWFKDKAHRFVLRRGAKRAKHIITTSEFVKHDIHKTLGIPEGTMTTVYQAPFRNTMYGTPNTKEILDRFGLGRPYVLYVGAAYPHKNLERLLDAWKIFEGRYGNQFTLVLAGKEDIFYKRLKSKIQSPTSVVFTNFVEDHELSVLYENAELFVFPSLSEGFGLPPLEAMQCCVPVISSNASCLPEVLGEGAFYFDPEDSHYIADVMHVALSDNDLRREIKEKAQEELKRFSWERLAKQTLNIYKSSI